MLVVMTSRSAIREKRVTELIADFPRFLGVFEEDPAFIRSGQLESHQQTIALLRKHTTVGDALADDHYLESLRSTLNAWGIGKRASRLAEPDRFASELRNRSDDFRQLERIDLTAATVSVRDRVWDLITTIEIVDNEARIVAMTKTLHHILPDLVPPVDRAYTGTFLRWQIPEFQNRQQEIFISAWSAIQRCARGAPVVQYVGSHPWNTSLTKVIDNAIVGYCIDKALDTGTRATRTQSSSRRPAPEPADSRPRRESWSLEDLEADLREFESQLRSAGLKESSVKTYVGRSETFLRWLAGKYRPRGPNT